jgi:hypothetical protein
VLAHRLEVTPRTVRRDVDRLRALGYTIAAIKGPDGGYRLAAGSELPPLLFDDAQAVAIAVALQSTPSSGVDMGEAAERALATIRQLMPSRLRRRVDGVRFTDTEVSSRVDPAVLPAVSTAVRERQELRFVYRREDDESREPPRRTQPHALVARQGRWYLIAWDLDREDWRVFRLDRIEPRLPLGSVFAPRTLPSGDAQSLLSARFKGSASGDRWPCVGSVILELPAREVANWIGDGEVEELGERSCRVTIGSWSWMGVLASVARFDARFTVVGPEALLAASARLAERARESLSSRTPRGRKPRRRE